MSMRLTIVVAAALAVGSQAACAEELPPPPPQSARTATRAAADVSKGRRFVLIVTGLTGDAEHAAAFRRNAEAWRQALIARGGAAPDRVVMLFGKEGDEGETAGAESSGATRENIATAIGELAGRIGEEDALWVFLQGHGSHDERDAWLHLPGPDLTAAEWGELFAGVAAREQVFWITQSASGGFLRPLARRGRIVITATAPTGEINETLFPEVLAERLTLPAKLSDSNEDGRVSVLELFQSVSSQVAARYEEGSLAATEHALLDDNGDGIGAEASTLEADAPPDTNVDGPLAARTFLIE